MIRNYFLVVFYCFFNTTAFSQEIDYNIQNISPELLKNANAIVRENNVDVTLESSQYMKVNSVVATTVLNESGDNLVGAYLHYDDGISIKHIQALVFDAKGKQIKRIKKNDFKDVSAVDGATMYSDSRVKYLEYTPVSYPYTIQFSYETVTKNTAFINPFVPVTNYFLGVENAKYTLTYPSDLAIRKKEKNFEGFNIEMSSQANSFNYEVSNIKAIKPEDHSPGLSSFTPSVLFASNRFYLEGAEAQVENWQDFGLWMYNDLIKSTNDLPERTINEIRQLVAGVDNPIEKAKIVYKYVQEKTRYISVQVGIGGWKPFNASYVDRLSYGDCKALTNYTMSLLGAVNVPSNYTVVFSGSSKRSLEKDFASMQGNHVILSIPNMQDTLWLECTSQKTPFGFIGDFTDDRDVLVITPEGGKIQRTKKYKSAESTQLIKGSYSLSEDGSIKANVEIASKGIQYDNKYYLDTYTDRDLKVNYKEQWSYVNGLELEDIKLSNNKEEIEFTENVSFAVDKYADAVGDRFLITANVFNKNTFVPKRYRSRKLPLVVNRGYTDIDEVEIKIPESFKIESIPESKNIESKFGAYKITFEKKDNNTIFYKRVIQTKDGKFSKEEYTNFRNFYKKINQLDNLKITLTKH